MPFSNLELQNSLRQKHFFCEPQSILNRQLKVVAVELLIRWNHPFQGVLLPGAFLPQIKSRELLQAIDFYVLNKALAYRSKLSVVRPHPKDSKPHKGDAFLCRTSSAGSSLKLAVNFADATVNHANLEGVLKGLLSPFDSLAGIEIEVSEKSLISPLRIRNLRYLRSLGAQIVLDDVGGKGYAEITKIRDLPAQKIKLDRSLIARCFEPKTQSILKHLIKLARELSLDTCAEGIEQQTELETLKSMNCSLFQGFLFNQSSFSAGAKLPREHWI